MPCTPVAPGVLCPLPESSLPNSLPERRELAGQLGLQLLHLHAGGDSVLLAHASDPPFPFLFFSFLNAESVSVSWKNLAFPSGSLVWRFPSNRACPPCCDCGIPAGGSNVTHYRKRSKSRQFDNNCSNPDII